MSYFILANLMQLATVQLKGKLTYADRAHATYWLKVRSYINLYWRVRLEKPANIIAVKGKKAG